MASIHAIPGDITTCAVDAVVNAANLSLLGGGGVDVGANVAGRRSGGGSAIEGLLGELIGACQRERNPVNSVSGDETWMWCSVVNPLKTLRFKKVLGTDAA